MLGTTMIIESKQCLQALQQQSCRKKTINIENYMELMVPWYIDMYGNAAEATQCIPNQVVYNTISSQASQIDHHSAILSVKNTYVRIVRFEGKLTSSS